eukprot:CAMPEP_0175970504 /NCGR_PEP_ID=MMETSP0108-20121206/41097_1 /TAXON_ID=195067 ORGANISM="Goniomonas pacifica, Strain CCMP1869" /NCGR_SAMPLE_ID=MMETSP0108 /ASSEMBLY_ACC=CAM_ASM_000204 /LENGTH=64 /DNA_ID=CAMNT_0017299491 /DNA_START=17 /DNA_END=208 /DNA_ORIENTATION=+
MAAGGGRGQWVQGRGQLPAHQVYVSQDGGGSWSNIADDLPKFFAANGPPVVDKVTGDLLFSDFG